MFPHVLVPSTALTIGISCDGENNRFSVLWEVLYCVEQFIVVFLGVSVLYSELCNLS